MLVTVKLAAFFSTLGFAAWISGYVFGFKGVSVIGGAIVLILGGFVTIDGMHYQSGVEKDNTLTVLNNSTTSSNTTDVEVAVNETDVNRTYERLSGVNAFRLGFVVMLLGAAQIFQAFAMDQS